MHVKSDNKIKIEIPIFIVNMHSNQDKNESVKGVTKTLRHAWFSKGVTSRDPE
jgi:hypothetical protein